MGKFLNTAFSQAISATGLGTANFDGRGHVLKATSNDWLSVTYMMKHLADATTGIPAGGDAGKAAAQAAYDQVAAIFLDCGNKNPVELPTFPNVTWGTTYATKGPTYYTVAGAMQEMSVSYGQQNATSKASTAAEGVVAELVKGPSAAGVTSITDAVPTPSTIGVTACGVGQLSLTDADCQALYTANCDAVDVDGVNEAKDIAGSPTGSFDFDFPLCCNIASNAPAGYAITTPLAIADVIQPGAGWVDVNWLGAGLYRYAADGAGAGPSANGNAYNANHGTTFPTLTGAAAAAGGPNFGGLDFNQWGVITQPASQCTNTRANAMGVGNSMALTTPTTSQQGQGDGAGGGTATDLASGVIQMNTATTRLVPYYIGQFGGAAGTTGGCKKMQAVQSFATDDPAEAAGTTAGGTEPMASVSTAIDIIGGCGAGMSDFASNHCTDGGNKDTGADNTAVVANTELVNPRIASVLGGQAVWNIIAATFYSAT